ncbi:MAG: amidohydrolase family protein, partial [Caldisphaera sp.]|nr:amidohydrolase family protein [Caldisphaera sp.]
NSIDYEAKKIHITHASCPSTVYEAKKFNYTVDSTPHHIFYDSNNMGCYYRVNPPLRDRETKYSLFKLLIDGQIDAMCSDHAPHSDREKNNFITCPSGIPWLGLWPWLVFKLVTLGLISIDRFLFLLSYSPAKILGLINYGYIDRNARADLIVIDKSMKWRFVETFSKAPYNMHFMEEMYGFPIKVFVGGKLVSDYRNIIDRPEPINPFAK